jgi:5-methylcytosine-specific restriction endonuclease McrA
MAKLKMHKPNQLQVIDTRTVKVPVVADRRITGRRLQARRYAVWLRNPTCAKCGRVVPFPSGFELDHKVPLHKGGLDTEENCQVLCVHVEIIDGQRIKTGCHVEKSAADQQSG